MNVRRALGALLVATLCACATNGEALDLRSATAALTAPVGHAQPFFRFKNEMSLSDDPAEAGVYTALTCAGLLAAYRAPSLLEGRSATHYRLTAKGNLLALRWRKLEHGVFEVPVGDFKLVSVLGIEMLESRHAMVHFSYVLEPNAMGRLLRAGGHADCAEHGPLAYFDRLKTRYRDLGSASDPASEFLELTLYDNGWRTDTSSF